MAVQGTTTQKPWLAPFASLAFLGIGLFLVKVCVYDVLDAAKHGESVSVSLKGIVLAPGMVVGGIVATVASFTKATGWAERFTDPKTKRLGPLGWVVAAAMLGAGFGLYLWLRSQLAAYGYEL